MKKTMLFILIFSLSLKALQQKEEVCLTIDQKDTGHKKYANIATEVEDFTQSFKVFHGQKFCFDLSKNYYMQYFLWETSTTIVYGTKCFYEPKKDDENKILLYEGESGGTPCPIVDSE